MSTVTYAKQRKRTEVYYDSGDECLRMKTQTIEAMIRWLVDLKEKYPGERLIASFDSGDEYAPTLTIYYEREETDDELRMRMERDLRSAEIRKEATEAEERRQYARLKKKFEGDGP